LKVRLNQLSKETRDPIYRKTLALSRNFAERTRIEYQNDLEGLVIFLEQSGIAYVKDLALPTIERYMSHLEQKGLGSLTRKRKVVAIRSFFSFLYHDGYINTNIALKIVLPFTESTLPNVLTQTECNYIREACAGNPRDAAIIELLLQTGIKLSELAALTLNDIDLDSAGNLSRTMRISGGRGKKERVIPLNTKASTALKNYLGVREGTENNLLFLNRFGETLGERGVQKMLKKYLKKSGVERATIQTLRHTFGAQHIAKGTSLKTIQEVMGLK
jgi:site-specific recombinase XerD